MKKNYVIITEELKKEPGIYGIKTIPETEDSVKLDIEDGLSVLGDLGNWKNIKENKVLLGKAAFKVVQGGNSAIDIGKKIFKENFSKERFYLDKIPSDALMTLNEAHMLKSDLIQNGITIKSENFENGYHLFNDPIFDGCFKNESELEKILPKKSDFTLFIIEKSMANRFFANTKSLELGLHVLDLDERLIFPMKNYQQKKWRCIELALRSTFYNLGLKRLYIKEVENVTGTVNFSKLIKMGSNLKVDWEIEYEEIWEDSIYDPEKAKIDLGLLKDTPLFYSIAQDLIDKPRKGKIKRVEKVDFSLGIDIGVLTTFEKNIEREKKLEIEIEF